MKVRTPIAAFGAAALVCGGAALIPSAASASSAPSVTHTLKFTAVTLKTASFSKNSAGQVDRDANKAGKIIGFDQLSFNFNPKTKKLSAGVTVDTNGGFIYGTITVTNSSTTHGKVTGGTGKFKGISGTLVAKQLNKSGTRSAVTVTYHG